MKYGFVKTAAITPEIRVADAEFNGDNIIAWIEKAEKAERKDDEILIRFSNCADGLVEKGNLRDRLFIKSGEKDLDYEYEIRGDVLRLKAQLPVAAVSVEYCETNYCPAVLFNSEGNPLFGFRCEV